MKVKWRKADFSWIEMTALKMSSTIVHSSREDGCTSL